MLKLESTYSEQKVLTKNKKVTTNSVWTQLHKLRTNHTSIAISMGQVLQTG